MDEVLVVSPLALSRLIQENKDVKSPFIVSIDILLLFDQLYLFQFFHHILKKFFIS